MKLDLVDELLDTDDPLVPVYSHLRGIWSRENFEEAVADGQLNDYLASNEHRASQFEREIWDTYGDLYALFENDHERKNLIEDIRGNNEYTLVIFDAMSLREVPAVLELLEDEDVTADVDFAMSEVPSDTKQFTSRHFFANGPTQIAGNVANEDFAFRYIKHADDPLDFDRDERARVIWVLYPDNVFSLDSGAVDYEDHIVNPIQQILRKILESDPVLPLTITSDHGYVWQGGDTAWTMPEDDMATFADVFKGGRHTDNPGTELLTEDRAWLAEDGDCAAARGRFAWGAKVRGATKLYKHGGVSLMECMVPRITANGGTG